jgi:hypothetical protein
MVSTAITFVAALAPDAQGHPALANHRTHSATAINGWSSVLFGLPFAAAGASVSLVALDIISSARKNAAVIWNAFRIPFARVGLRGL